MALVSRAVCLLLFSLALCQAVSGQGGVQDITTTFTDITTLSANLRIVVDDTNLVTVIFDGPKIAQGLGNIINRIAPAARMLQNMQPLGDADAKVVVQSLTTFVQVHQQLLSAIIGKHGLLPTFGFAEPVRAALVQLESSVDAFAFAFIAIIPTQQPAANTQLSSLRITIQDAVEIYHQ